MSLLYDLGSLCNGIATCNNSLFITYNEMMTNGCVMVFILSASIHLVNYKVEIPYS